MIGVVMEVAKASFFDRKPIVDAVDRATGKALSKMGAFIRTRARTSIRYRQAVSEPDAPPSAHRTATRKKLNRKTGEAKTQLSSPLRDSIVFAFDRQSQSVVVGPTLLSGRGGSMVLSALEHGGESEVKEHGKTRRITVRARPFMRPALEHEQGKLAGLLAGSVR